MGLLSHTAKCLRILIACVQMPGTGTKMRRQELRDPSHLALAGSEDIGQKPVLRGGQREGVAYL